MRKKRIKGILKMILLSNRASPSSSEERREVREHKKKKKEKKITESNQKQEPTIQNLDDLPEEEAIQKMFGFSDFNSTKVHLEFLIYNIFRKNRIRILLKRPF